MELGLRGKVLLVSGGASGLGRDLVSAALGEGMRVAVLDRDAYPVRDGDVFSIEVDVTDREDVRSAVSRVTHDFGEIDALVTCAAVAPVALAEEVTLEHWVAAIDVNLSGTFHVAQAVADGMLARRRGAMVMVGSANSFGGQIARTPYVASKHGVLGLVRSLAVEWGPRGVRVNLLAPGPIDTPMLRRNNTEEQLRKNMYNRLPLGRMSQPIEQAKVALFLLSDAAAIITGASLCTDLGLTAGYQNNYSVLPDQTARSPRM